MDASAATDADAATVASESSTEAAADAAPDVPTSCQSPARDCTGAAAFCNELIQFQPPAGPGYEDYPLNGETASNQYRSYARRELVALIKYAAAFVQCSAQLDGGNGAPLGLGDMSEANGAIPGTSVGSPAHPAGTHTNGTDIDVAYYQLLPPDNHLRAVCPHMTGAVDEYHCVAAPDNLDMARTALFLGIVLTSPRLRVIGVDGMIGPALVATITNFCSAGVLPQAACSSLGKLQYETTDTGLGWFLFRHTNAHISLSQ